MPNPTVTPINLPSWSDEVPPTTNADTKSLVFDGDNHAELANPSSHNSAFDFPAGFTIEAWIKPDSSKPGQDAGIVSKFKKEVGYGGYILWLSGGKIENYIDGGLPGLTNVVDGNWHHVAITWDGVERTVYVDGIKEKSAAWSAPPNSVDSIFYIATYDPADRNFKGNIDEVMVYNYARTDAQIKEDAGIIHSVVINELMWPGHTADSDDEWLELRNMTSSDIDLTGWTLEGARVGTAVIELSGVIPANSLFLISNFSQESSSLNIVPDLVNPDLQLDNDDLQVLLKNKNGVTVDMADDGSGVPLAGSNASPKASMERITPIQDGTLGTSWETATTTVNLDSGVSDKGTPKAEND